MSEENQQPLSLEDIKGLLSEIKSELSQELNQAVTGMGTKLKKSLQAEFSTATEDNLEERIKASVRSVFDEAVSTQPEEPADTPQQQPKEIDIESLISERLQSAIAPYEKAVEDARKLAETERLNASRTKFENDFYRQLQGKVNDPELFLTALEKRRGAYFDPEKGVYGIKGKDEFDNETFTPVTDLPVNELIQSQDFSAFKPSRPGSGLDSQPGQTTQPERQPTIYEQSNVDDSSRFDALKKAAAQGIDPYELLGS